MLLKRTLFACLLLLCATPRLNAAVTFVQYASSVPTTSSGTVAFGSNVTAGDILCYIVTGFSTSSATPTDTLSTTYSLLTQTGGTSNVLFYVGKAGSSGANTVSFSGVNASNVLIVVEEWSGVAGVYLGNVGTQGGTTYSLTNATSPLTAQGGVMLVFATQTVNNTTFTFSGGTIRAQANPPAVLSCVVGDEPISQQTVVNNLTVSMTLGSGGSGAMGMVYLEPIASGGASAANSAYAN